MPRTFSKSAFYSFGDIPLAAPLPLIFSQLLSNNILKGRYCENRCMHQTGSRHRS